MPDRNEWLEFIHKAYERTATGIYSSDEDGVATNEELTIWIAVLCVMMADLLSMYVAEIPEFEDFSIH